MIEKFAVMRGKVSSELLDLNHTSKRVASSVPYDFEVRSRHQQQALASFEIGAPA